MQMILCPRTAGRQQLLHICSPHGVEHIHMVIEPDKHLVFPEFEYSDINAVCNKVKYLEHVIIDQMMDDKVIYRHSWMM